MKIEKVKIQVPKCELTFFMNVLKRIQSYRPCADLHNVEIKISEY